MKMIFYRFLMAIAFIAIMSCAISPTSKLYDSVRNGTIDEMLAYLEQIPDPSKREVINGSLLIASSRGHSEIVKALIEKGGDINSVNDMGRSPLMNAAESGHLALVSLLLAEGADINCQSIVFMAKDGTFKKHKDYVEYDIEKTKKGHNALSLAIINGHTDVVKLLLQQGSDPNNAVIIQDLCDTDAFYPWSLNDLLHILNGDLGINHLIYTTDPWSLNNLLHMLNRGDMFINYSNVAFTQIDRMHVKTTITNEVITSTPLILAVSKGDITIVHLLLQYGADVNLKNNIDYTTGLARIHFERVSGLFGLVVLHYILDAGTGIQMNSTLIQKQEFAPTRGNFDKAGNVKYLSVCTGPSPCSNPRHLLGRGSNEGREPNVMFVGTAKSGGSLFWERPPGKMRLHVVTSGGDQAFALPTTVEEGKDYLVKYWYMQARFEITEICRDKNDFDAVVRHEGTTALYAASQAGHIKIVKMLLDGGVYVNIKDKDGNTPIMGAIRNGHLPIVKLLVQAGANIQEKNNQGMTAIGAARLFDTQIANYLNSIIDETKK